MKCVVMVALLVVALTSAELSPEMKAHITEYMRDIATTCAKQEGADPQEVANLMQKIVPTSREGKCALACMNVEMKVQTPDGKMSLEGSLGAIEFMKEAEPKGYSAMAAIITRCYPETESVTDRCDVAVKFAECGIAIAHEFGM